MAQVLSDELLVLYFTRMVYGWVRIRLPCIGCREGGRGWLSRARTYGYRYEVVCFNQLNYKPLRISTEIHNLSGERTEGINQMSIPV